MLSTQTDVRRLSRRTRTTRHTTRSLAGRSAIGRWEGAWGACDSGRPARGRGGRQGSESWASRGTWIGRGRIARGRDDAAATHACVRRRVLSCSSGRATGSKARRSEVRNPKTSASSPCSSRRFATVICSRISAPYQSGR